VCHIARDYAGRSERYATRPAATLVAHNLERSGDRVTNICERVVYQVTGRLEEMNVSTY
jgi:phosphate uptake regulator